MTETMLRFDQVMRGISPDRTPVAPKIWLDWAAARQGAAIEEVLRDPRAAMHSIVRVSMDMGFDAARLFLLPRREAVWRGGRCCEVDPSGRVVGEIDVNGGWTTRLADGAPYPLDSRRVMLQCQTFCASEPPVQDMQSIRRMAVPDVAYLEEQGYGEMVDQAAQMAKGRLSLIGDCNTGTLSFLIAMRGMEQALFDLADEPELACACMDKGIALALERARFFVKHGVFTLRYNDSAANMMVISPAYWRRFIAERIRYFCAEVHKMDARARVYCHICGSVLPILEDLVDCGLDCIAPLDPLGGVSPALARRRLGDGVPIMGGVNTLTLLDGSEEEVFGESRRCVEEGGRLFILGSGCAVARDTPARNLEAMRRAAAGA